MQPEVSNPESGRSQRIELLIQEFDTLPTLGAVAVRLLELTTDESAEAREVIDLVASDPALASKVLALCRCHERGRASNVTTIDRAVLLLGFEAVRCAVLSVRVFEVLDGMGSPAGEQPTSRPVFDREAFWLHALGVAVVCERLAAQGTLTKDIRPAEAFMAGILHDIGQLVLHVLLPESFDRVCQIAETHSASLDRACREIIGVDTHTTGKRLAERWGLPPALVDVIWLNGQAFEALPQVPHRTLIALVTLADAIVRSRYITPGAHWSRNENLNTLCIPVGVSVDAIDAIAGNLHEAVADRTSALGLDISHDPAVLLRSICRANDSLARANAGMRQRERLADRQGRVLQAIREFHRVLPVGATTVEVLGAIAESAAGLIGHAIPAAIYLGADGVHWRLVRFGVDGRAYGATQLNPPADAIPLATLACDIQSLASAAALMPWFGAQAPEDLAVENLSVFPIATRGGSSRALILVAPPAEQLEGRDECTAIIQSWRAALESGRQHDAAGLLTEQLAEANRTVIDTQAALSRSQTMATLGEVAAGAAHEMNNPLTVISGRSQLLANKVRDPELNRMAREIVAETHRVSDMITALRSFAEPVVPKRKAVDLADLVVRAVQHFGPHEGRQPQVNTIFTDALPAALVDPDLLGSALGELVSNACESKGSRHIELRVQTEPPDDRLKIEVRDDGSGLSEHALRHAFDPFYSAKPAGRQPGLGLARARRFVEAHGGSITLINGPAGGAIATIRLPRWQADAMSSRVAA